jgi:hypothetical protein
VVAWHVAKASRRANKAWRKQKMNRMPEVNAGRVRRRLKKHHQRVSEVNHIYADLELRSGLPDADLGVEPW